MNFSRLGRGEFLAVLGGVALALSLFLPWYKTNPDNRNAMIDGMRGTVSGWTAAAGWDGASVSMTMMMDLCVGGTDR